jgi:hypothetical protein
VLLAKTGAKNYRLRDAIEKPDAKVSGFYYFSDIYFCTKLVDLYMETLIMHPKNKEQLKALKAIAKALKIDVELQKSPYNPEFVAMIKSAEQRGNYKTIDSNDIWGSLNFK